MRGRLLREGVDIEELPDLRTLLDVVESTLVDMAAEGVLGVLGANAKTEWPGWWAQMAKPPLVSLKDGVVELRIPSREWGVEIDDEPPPAPLRDEPGPAI